MWLAPPWVVNEYNPLAIVLALALDIVYPRHEGLLLQVHPVHTAFLAARRLAPPGSGVARGAAAWAVVMTAHLAPAAVLLYASWRLLGPAGWVVSASLVYKHSLSLRLLLDHVSRVAGSLGAGKLGEARAEVSQIVRRDTSRLGPGHVASAALESLAESLVDGFTSPLLYAALAGPLGALAQRIANTLDGALGFTTPDYLRAGRASAWADTVLNYLPARLTALALALTAPLAGRSPSTALKVVARFHGATRSRNAGYPISAMAGALGVCLEKPGEYTVNTGSPCPGAPEVRRGLRLAVAAAVLWLAATLSVAYGLSLAMGRPG